MTTRLYYREPERREFDATVIACDASRAGHEVRLDRTAFYPTSGGQPHDTGRLGGADVGDVFERENGEIVHVVDAPLTVGAVVHGEIDWTRRADHMQQHTGQHVLSAAFDRLSGVRTVSFHLGSESSTIDLAREVTPAEIARAEAEANRIVWENRPVRVRFVDEADAARLPLRKEPVRSGELRIIDVADFDLSACGGTHVQATGAIGIVAVAGWERFKGGSRVAFVCGGRALASHGRLRDVVTTATRLLSVAPGDLEVTVARLLSEERELKREVRRLGDELARHEAAAFRSSAETINGVRSVLRHVPGRDAAALKTIASAVVSEPGVFAVLVGDGDPAPVVAARSADLPVTADAMIKALVAAFGGRGGGRPDLAQGGVAARAPVIVEFARTSLERGRV